MLKNFLFFVIIGCALSFVLGFGFAWMLGLQESGATDLLSDEPGNRLEALSLPLGHNTLIVSEQYAGGSVFIALATLSRGAWVAIHEDSDGKPANILGARYFPAGKTAGTVDLLRATVPGRTYHAVVHQDDGDREFDFRTDEPLQDPFGNLVMSSFETFSGGSSSN